MLFQLSLGVWFSFAMVAMLSACILYQTSEVMHRFPSDMYVAAALMLFSSVVTLFYYIFRILMSFQSRD
jgi:FtsH-binding integral membrane protein